MRPGNQGTRASLFYAISRVVSIGKAKRQRCPSYGQGNNPAGAGEGHRLNPDQSS